MIATRDMPGRRMLAADALDAALNATSIETNANYMDTLACVYALKGDFTQAIKVENEALAKSPGNTDFGARLSLFHVSADCTGAK